ncbi:MAG: hypothetical protein ACFE92_16745 [Promethearchaeota archaeon]
MFLNYIFLGSHNNNSTQDVKRSITNNIREEISMSNDYQLVEPINISSWIDWALYPFITGNGSDLNPFIIENIEIIGDGVKTIQSGNDTLLDSTYVGIYINTNGSFIIQNCKISHISIGILLSIGISSGGPTYPIVNVEINDCSIGIYSRWQHVAVNISNCNIRNCNWVSITASVDINNYINYGGIGICVRSSAGIIEDCRIEDCSVGMMAGLLQDFHNNQLINCGFIPDYLFMFMMDYDSSNTVNGKPIGIFGSYWGDDNMVFTQANASQYGQLIFAVCPNLTLSDIHITEPCSIGIQLLSVSLNQRTYLNNIICENQKLGFYIHGYDMIGENLYAKNCDAGFYFVDIKNCNLTKIMTDNTDIPIYAITATLNCNIETEQYTKFYLVDPYAWYGDKLYVETAGSSYNITMSYISELGVQGYACQFNDTGIYRVSLTVLTYTVTANFTVISVPRYPRPVVSGIIPSYPLFWVWTGLMIGVIVCIESYRRGRRR